MERLKLLLKSFLYNHSIRKKLLFCSVLLTLTLATAFYWLSESFVSRLIVQEKAEYQVNEFKQTANYFKFLFADLDANTNKLVNEASIQKAVDEPFPQNDFSQIGQRVQTLTSEITDTLLYHDYIDKIMILGKNNLVYQYEYNEGGKYAGTDFNFIQWLNVSAAYLYKQQEGVPFYYNVSGAPLTTGFDEKALANMLDHRIAYYRPIRLENETIGTLVVTFNIPEFAKEVFNSTDADETLQLLTNQHLPIWSNKSTGLDKEIFPASQQSDDTSYKIIQKNGSKVLVTHFQLSSYPFELMSEFPISSILTGKGGTHSLVFFFGLGTLVFVLILSFWFAGTLSKPLFELSQGLSAGIGALDEREPLEPRIILPNYRVRSKLIAYFVLTTFVPNLLFVLLLTYVHYDNYQNKVMQLTESTIQQVKRNINYSLKNYDRLTQQLIYHPEVQQTMRKSETTSLQPTDNMLLELQFGNIKQRKREFLSMELYNRSRERIYSGMYAGTVPISKTDPRVFEKLDNSSGELQLIGTYRNLYMTPVLTFARKISSSSVSNLGSQLGYLIVNVEQDVLNNIFRTIRIGDSGYFFLIDANGTILSHDNDDLTSHVLEKEDPLVTEMMQQTSGSYFKNAGNKRYMVFYDTASYFGVKMVGIVPSDELKKKVFTLVWYSAAFFVLFGILIMLIATLISSLISKPLRKLQNLMHEVNEGNFEARMNHKGRDEIASLARHFNNMIKRLNELITENYQSKIREKELMFLEKEAQLHALQQQINPHFLYNTLESIKWMAFRQGAGEIVEMTTALGQFFRGSISKKSGLVRMSEELDHLEQYLRIQKIRAKNRFIVIWDVSDELQSSLTVKLILQPIVENAIVHGLDTIESDGLLMIKGYLDGSHMHIEILDNGAGMSMEQLQHLRLIEEEQRETNDSGIGLINVFQRLHLYFNDSFTWDIDSQLGRGTLVRLHLPLLSEDEG
ncbi:HAMP domain-containing protein [Paenibacillus sp. LMG 31461]|uniref:HAMP domain-containing protein n=1 Tax=Paenibacillus plantarum TaxID=2654975 RepID=A0ABX1XFU9_9BACL|nr:sensor histidine kinase [Paenibacillus plantarum]NOU67179.1 HAMP domain-containing protein [Paenibacillus plantarum]